MLLPPKVGMKDIVNIRTQRLWPHPGNPRKEPGDLTELAESIRKNGIMQNLTAVPLELVSPDDAKKLLFPGGLTE